MTLNSHLQISRALPADAQDAMLVGRAWLQGQGAVLVQVRPDGVYDLSRVAPTCSQLLELPDPAAAIRAAAPPRIADTAAVLANSAHDALDASLPWLLAPCDLQAVKAAGVTFVASMLERVIEEQARGDAWKAESVRKAVVGVIGDNLSAVKPGSPEALRLKDVLISQGVWSQYLEVGIGVDAEIFTKSQPMSSVGTGAEIGIHPASSWNNPEPEIVLAGWMPISAPVPTELMGCDLVKISASTPMPTSRYCDHTPCEIRTSFSRSASGEPGLTALRLSPITPTTALRTDSAFEASPRACSSITRSSMDATKVTPAAFTACRSQGASSQGSEGSSASCALLARTAAASAIRGGAAARMAAAGSGSSSSWLLVAATRERSYTPSGRTCTRTAPWPCSQARPTSTASCASTGRAREIWRWEFRVMVRMLTPGGKKKDRDEPVLFFAAGR